MTDSGHRVSDLHLYFTRQYHVSNLYLSKSLTANFSINVKHRIMQKNNINYVNNNQ